MTSTEKAVHISAQMTPNPNTLKFLVDFQIFESGGIDFPTEEKAAKSHLPSALFKIEAVEGVFIGANFISVTKSDKEDWSRLVEPVTDTIQDVFASGKELLDPELKAKQDEAGADNSEVSQKIRDILDQEIRPAVAMDGGDITFGRYEDGVVYLHLQGACSSCPASTMTLKMGIENRLKEEIPEIKEVIQV